MGYKGKLCNCLELWAGKATECLELNVLSCGSVEGKNTESHEGNEGLACGFQEKAKTLRAICVTF